MSGLILVVTIIAIFFSVGALLGVTTIISLSVISPRGWRGRTWPQHRPYSEAADPNPGPGGGYPGGPPYWPDNGYQD